MVIITNTCDPTGELKRGRSPDCAVLLTAAHLRTRFFPYCAGVLMSEQEVKRAAQMCRAAGCWLLLDNTYEDFVYGGRRHYSSPEPNVVHVFSMSKVR